MLRRIVFETEDRKIGRKILQKPNGRIFIIYSEAGAPSTEVDYRKDVGFRRVWDLMEDEDFRIKYGLEHFGEWYVAICEHQGRPMSYQVKPEIYNAYLELLGVPQDIRRVEETDRYVTFYQDGSIEVCQNGNFILLEESHSDPEDFSNIVRELRAIEEGWSEDKIYNRLINT